MSIRPQHMLAGAAAFGAAVWGGYTYAKSVKQLQQQQQSTAANGQTPTASAAGDGRCAFDRLATVYDSIIGAEERWMLYGLLRWWLLRNAQGDVLEISAGTGRNLSHYPYSNISSLTLTDVSASMLQQAQHKFFDTLQLQYKQPELSCRFLMADAQHLVAAAGQQPHAVPLHAVSSTSKPGSCHMQQQQQPHSAVSSSSSGSRISEDRSQGSGGLADDHDAASSTQSAGAAGAVTKSVWRFKQQHSSSSSSGGGGGGSSASTSHPQVSAAANTSADNSDSSSTRSKGITGCSSRPQQATSPCGCQKSSSSGSSSSGGSGSSDDGSSQPGSTFAPGSFDVVVDTFGLCSCDNPVEVLQQAAQLVKPGGKLLLLEHGRSKYDWLNNYMDARAARHHDTFGCWYNRDILEIVDEAGLRVDSLSRWHFGTSYVIVASPPRAGAPPAEAAKAA